ncbi:heat shock 70 kDa protein 12A-like [Mercenaria mercenaria]|uniref:heat shock 70 kDa protein 12A-like n=1 Tax=Mercenaria mercenaria TaxID=6596 RepID=UPI00234E425A|nr:heat shock 70 kDa protein 12A-like [Mercenaria mercenaria]
MTDAVKNAFPDKQIIVPDQPDLACVSTAVPFDEKRHPNSKQVLRDGIYKCEDVFSVFVKAGTTVVPHKTRIEYTFGAPFMGTSRATVEVYRSKSENPMYMSDKGCYRIGEISVALKGRPKEDKQLVDVVMLFGDTELHVTAKEHGTNKLRPQNSIFLNRRNRRLVANTFDRNKCLCVVDNRCI